MCKGYNVKSLLDRWFVIIRMWIDIEKGCNNIGMKTFYYTEFYGIPIYMEGLKFLKEFIIDLNFL